jgi:hypothetical protein
MISDATKEVINDISFECLFIFPIKHSFSNIFQKLDKVNLYHEEIEYTI